jgi:hypothetical protein
MQSAENMSVRPRRIGAALGAALLMTVAGCTGDDEKPFAGELPPPGTLWETLEPPQPDVADDGTPQEQPGTTAQDQSGNGRAGNGPGGIGTASGGSAFGGSSSGGSASGGSWLGGDHGGTSALGPAGTVVATPGVGTRAHGGGLGVAGTVTGIPHAGGAVSAARAAGSANAAHAPPAPA